MYTNKCIKCGAEFETKNPKRVICPACLYADKKNGNDEEQPKMLNSYTAQSEDTQPQRGYYSSAPRDGYNRPRGQRPYNNANRPYNSSGGRYNNNSGRGGYNNRYGSGGGNYRNNNRPYNKNFKHRPPQRKKQLLISKEQLAQIEVLYKKALPLPNHDIHEVIGQALGIEPRKVFFGINLIRQKMMLPVIPFPKRKLAVTQDQLTAIKTLYMPLLPLPPIGCHKIIAAQLRMDEWRVHVGIGLIRKQIGLERWQPDRPDAPEEYKIKKDEQEQQQQ